MSGHYLIVSLPGSAAPSNNEELQTYLEKDLAGGRCAVSRFQVPSFKVGTLDSLVQQSEELAKLDTTIGGFLSKIDDILASLYDGQEGLIAASKKVDGKSPINYIESFSWNTTKYRYDNKSVKELIDAVLLEAFDLDTDLRNLYSSYNTAKSNLGAANRKQNGDLSVVLLHDIVGPQHFVLGLEHLQTLLVVVPKNLQKEWLATYESLSDFVVPRLSTVIKEDNDYVLNNVTLFKKYVDKFTSACREKKFLPREFNYSEGLVLSLRQEYAMASQQESQLRGELIRFTRTAYADILAAALHVKTLRVFVESVLRYGLPPDFKTFFLRSSATTEGEKVLEKAKNELIHEFGYLGGNAFGKDKKGRVIKDDGLGQYGGLVDTEYEPFVLYLFSIN